MPTLTVNIAYDEAGSGVTTDPGQAVTIQALNDVVQTVGGVTYTVEPWPIELILVDGQGSVELDAGYYWVHRFGASKLVHLTADARLDQLASIDPATLDPEAEPAAAWDERVDGIEDRVTTLEGAILGGGGSGIEYTQATPLATWTIPHSFGRRPNVAVYVAGEEVITDVAATDTQAVIIFASPTAGVAVLT